MSEFKVSIGAGFSGFGEFVKVFLLEYTGEKLFTYTTNGSGELVRNEYKDNDVDTQKCLFKIKGFGVGNVNPILRAMVEGLKEVGFVAEVDNSQRITAQALAEERAKMLEIEQKRNNDMVGMILKSITGG